MKERRQLLLDAALYDMDGLIVDSEPLHGLASAHALRKYGRSHDDIPDEVRNSFFGKRVIDVSRLIVECLELPVTAEQWAEERHSIFMGLIENGITLMPGVEQSLDYFESVGARLAVVSSGDRRYVARILELTGLAGRFQTVVTGDDVSAGKPDPQCFLLGASRLAADPSRCLVLEDALAGVRAARAAGMKVIGIRNRFNSRFDGADAVLDSLAEIDSGVLEALYSRVS